MAGPIFKSRFWISTVLLLVVILQSCSAHRIDVDPGKKECFFEDLHHEDQLTDPTDQVLSSIHRKPTGTFAFTAKKDGRYTYCFSNEMSTLSPKVLSFNVHGILYVEDENGHIAPVEHEIRQLAAGLQGIKDEQEYIVVRERVHRDTAESTNDRVKWWSILQTFMLVAVCAWNVHYLKSWFEVKRVL
ncbi:hypothetical protein QFC20_002335 [Naganishia adeliensis]|uniref:Uncharacterized protein n=1 Tax=Naganishia adeliensis TaxID=92952 RepID=A0ACC2WLW5_9TREE|nr:hypothetical protein QFC20_002335 [Naganishia adeliensis]